ncbi:MAG: GNAT family N-acetyltransferase [Leptolyngbyaceae cyanobacterium]
MMENGAMQGDLDRKMTNIQYSLAQKQDLDLLMQLSEEFYELDGHQFEPDKAQHALLGIIDNDLYGRICVILGDDTAIGYVALMFGYSLEYHGRDAILDEIYLRAPFRGQGIGTQTFAFVESACRQLGINTLHLEVMDDNEAARSLYGRLGYRSRASQFMHKRL